jgi:hypothetical protein
MMACEAGETPMIARLVATALLLAALSHPAAAADPAPRGEVAIKAVVLSDHAPRYTLPIKVGGTVIEAGLDTGSTGLRILPGVLADADAKASSRGETYAYGSGAKYDGVGGEGVLAIGGLEKTASLQLIQRVGCVERIPNCPASRVPQGRYGIQGDGLPGEGFKAILGTNLSQANIDNPLVALGVRRWIVELPRPGEDKPGRLILNPTDDEVRGYVMLPMIMADRAPRGGLHDAVPGCLTNTASKAKACGPLSLDSGAPGIQVANGGLGGQPWPPGTPATISFYDAAGHPQAAEALTIGLRQHASHLSFNSQPRFEGPAIYTGIAAYLGFSVLYDAEHGRIGLKPRPPMQGGPQAEIVAAAP